MKPDIHKKPIAALAVVLAAIPSLALADPTCVYVLGTVGSRTVSTPAIMVVVPDSSATIQPIRVHIDPIDQTIMGYTVRLPGQDLGTDAQTVFVQGYSVTQGPIVATLDELNLDTGECVNVNGSTPAVPVYVPGSALETPGAVVETPEIALNILGTPVTAPGQVINLPAKSIVVPDIDETVPGVPFGTPDQSITVDLNPALCIAEYLIPNTQL